MNAPVERERQFERDVCCFHVLRRYQIRLEIYIKIWIDMPA